MKIIGAAFMGIFHVFSSIEAKLPVRSGSACPEVAPVLSNCTLFLVQDISDGQCNLFHSDRLADKCADSETLGRIFRYFFIESGT